MQFRVLGPVEVSHGGKTLVFSGSKVGQVLSLLIARSNSTVTIETLIEELWGEQVPRSVLTTLQTYVYLARKRLKEELGIRDPEHVIVTRSSGYLIAADGSAVDENTFRRLLNEGNNHMAEADPESAAARLTEAVNLWRGPAFADVPTGTILGAHVTYLDELRLAAMGLRLEARQRLGRYIELIPDLRSLVAANPLNERFHAQLIDALHRCGRRAEALQAYRSLWHILDAELGVQPAPDVQRLHQEVLAHGNAARRRAPYSYPVPQEIDILTTG